MSELKRYSMSPLSFESEAGDVVKYEDYKALEQKLESSELKLKEAVLALEVFKDCQSWSKKEKTCWEKGQILKEALSNCNKE